MILYPLCGLICVVCWFGLKWLCSFVAYRDIDRLPPPSRGYGVNADKQWRYKTGWGSRPL